MTLSHHLPNHTIPGFSLLVIKLLGRALYHGNPRSLTHLPSLPGGEAPHDIDYMVVTLCGQDGSLHTQRLCALSPSFEACP